MEIRVSLRGHCRFHSWRPEFLYMETEPDMQRTVDSRFDINEMLQVADKNEKNKFV